MCIQISNETANTCHQKVQENVTEMPVIPLKSVTKSETRTEAEGGTANITLIDKTPFQSSISAEKFQLRNLQHHTLSD